MRSSGLVRWMRAALAAATLSIALPFCVMAQQADTPGGWGVTYTPDERVLSNGDPWIFCMLWHGRSPQPLLNITLTDQTVRMNLAAAELAGGTGEELQVSLQFPRGQTSYIRARHLDGVIAVYLSEQALETVLHELSFDGTFTITSDRHGSYTFPPVNGLGATMNILRSCRRQLPAQ